jgi:hypothetical protein
MHVTRISRYIMLSIVFGIIRLFCNRGRSWNVLPVDTAVHLHVMKILDWQKIKEQDSQVTNNCNQYERTVHSNARPPTKNLTYTDHNIFNFVAA